MSIKEFIQDNFGELWIHIICMIAGSSFLLFTGTGKGIVGIILIAWLILLVLIMLVRWYKVKSYFKYLDSVMNGLDKKYLFIECIDKPKKAYERHFFSYMKRCGKSMIEAVSDAESDYLEYQEYIEDWVHEIKVPITSGKLICKNNTTDVSRKLLVPMTQIEEHVERVLYYARAGRVEQDFVIKKTLLSDIVRESISRYQPLLIQSGIRIEVSELNHIVYTDGKWVDFMIGQFLSNSIRYKSPHPIIAITSYEKDEKVSVTIRDNGIGISPHDLTRIFQRGFTGDNGRTRGGSTGMGLYICNKLADALEMELLVDSVENEYTLITLSFQSFKNVSRR